ncbi:unnamed protein product [Fusarium venenatum]|uniref:Uncharacterized protein n=1 Tax=Fusarium venenatum TaxID=56646 RepID=A0A2L2TGM8_9HYPO|nr:uncharacterized protein FVRRES_10201 [Fusarium venenatum]CEI70124.1 unnamed protein product [Fusarium venenatum]
MSLTVLAFAVTVSITGLRLPHPAGQDTKSRAARGGNGTQVTVIINANGSHKQLFGRGLWGALLEPPRLTNRMGLLTMIQVS